LAEAIGKPKELTMPHWNLTTLVQLDKTVNQYMQDGKSPFSTELRNALDEEYVIPPHYTDVMDCRRPVDDYVRSKLDAALQEIFDRRKEVE
jgi:hypothetical protein